MSSDKKKLQKADWATLSDEQDTFGSQSPYAAAAQPAAPFHEGGPSHQVDNAVDAIDAPPVYTPSQAPYQPPHQPLPPPKEQQQNQYQQHPAQPVSPGTSVPFYAPPQQPSSPVAPLRQSEYLQPLLPPPHVAPPRQPEYRQPLLSPSRVAPPRQPEYRQQNPQYPRGAGAAPIDYGAIPNPNGNYGTSPGPINGDDSSKDQVLRRQARRKKKQSFSCCSCCCLLLLLIIFLCWNVRGFFVLPDDACWTGTDGEFITKTEVVSALDDLSLDFLVVDGITGNVVVKESESWDVHDVRIQVVMRATTAELLGQLRHSIVQDTYNVVHARVHINDQLDKDARKRLLSGNCARADVTITYPSTNPGTGKLSIGVANGELSMEMSPHHIQASFEEVQLSLTNGDVNVDSVVVSKKFLAEVGNGNVNGSIKSAAKVRATTLNGIVTLKVDSAPLKRNWREDMLEVEIENVNGRINLDLVQRFQGHFDLSNAYGSKGINLASDSEDIITYSTQGSQRLTGWISRGGVEPKSQLPRLALYNVNGPMKVNVETKT